VLAAVLRDRVTYMKEIYHKDTKDTKKGCDLFAAVLRYRISRFLHENFNMMKIVPNQESCIR